MQLDRGISPPLARPSLRRVWPAVRFVGMSVLGFLVFLIVLYRFANPPGSTLMAYEALTGSEVRQRWVPLGSISTNLIKAVILSEDGRFCQHRGVDWTAISQAIDSAGDDGPRGASTISMQTVKNVFLWSSRSYVRKAIEIPLTYVVEFAWSKRRILEIYLNIAEWGPGIYGAEMASRYYFGKSASRLSVQEAALLAAVLPDPRGRNAARPGPQTSYQASRLRQWLAGPVAWSCVRSY
jgi:monofunctional biosynthetic peptidoglycan transglycosylase